MIKQAKWLWLNKKDYPDVQKTTTWFAKNYADFACRFAEFKKTLFFDKQVKKVIVEISADVKYFLYVNGKYIGVGPVTPGGDYNSALPMPQQYYNMYEIDIEGTQVNIHALVQTLPIVQCDMTQGRNGFICACKAVFYDGSEKTFYSDETWRCRLHTAALECSVFDYTKQEDDWQNAEIIPSVWNLLPSEILNTAEEEIAPKGLVEGWVDCEAYGYDYSHVWAGTPTYQLPQKLSGLKILEAGFEKISLKPQLFGLEWAKIKIPTPKGVLLIDMKKSEKTKINVPDGIRYVLEE